MRRISAIWVAVFLQVVAGYVAAQDDRARIALVVGNAAYASVSPLDNPANDAALIADALRGSGFEVT